MTTYNKSRREFPELAAGVGEDAISDMVVNTPARMVSKI